jgi:hypothetical protein
MQDEVWDCGGGGAPCGGFVQLRDGSRVQQDCCATLCDDYGCRTSQDRRAINPEQTTCVCTAHGLPVGARPDLRNTSSSLSSPSSLPCLSWECEEVEFDGSPTEFTSHRCSSVAVSVVRPGLSRVYCRTWDGSKDDVDSFELSECRCIQGTAGHCQQWWCMERRYAVAFVC